MKIAVYSGSFNPLHIGHLAILEYLVNQTGFDKVYLIVSPVNPFKEGKRQTSAEERFRNAQEAVLRHAATLSRPAETSRLRAPVPGHPADGSNLPEADGDEIPELAVKVDDIELRMPAPHYTIKTLDALKAREPENDFTLIIGGDNLSAFTKWKDFRRIIMDYGLAVYPRSGNDVEEALETLAEAIPDCTEAQLASRISIIRSPLVDISSTAIREGMAAGRDISGFLM